MVSWWVLVHSGLWALLWPCNPCFIPHLNVLIKWTKLGIISENWEHFLCFTRLELGYQRMWAAVRVLVRQIQNWWWGSILGEKTSLVPSVFSCVLFSSWLFIPSPVWGTSQITLICMKKMYMKERGVMNIESIPRIIDK